MKQGFDPQPHPGGGKAGFSPQPLSVGTKTSGAPGWKEAPTSLGPEEKGAASPAPDSEQQGSAPEDEEVPKELQ